jgi:enamine deaminase RidA (YjgF/YER057c/UK114 family)
MISRFSPGTRSSLAVSHNGTLYFAVTPQSPYDPKLSATEQMEQLTAKAEERLTALGSGKPLLLFCAILLKDMADYAAVNAVWDRWIDPKNPPARCCFAAELANPDMKVEMVVIAAQQSLPQS